MSGVVAPHFTAFPTSIALAATWDPEAVEEMADLIRRQLRSVGLLQALAPVMDVARDAATGVTLPAQQLIGFARVDLAPGESKTVSFAVPLSLLAYTGLSGELILEPGPIEISAGSSSSDLRESAELTVTGKTRAFKPEERAFLSEATVGASGATVH